MSVCLSISDLGFTYPGKENPPVFENISLDLEKGEVFCLLGPNGSGKSTLLKCLVNLLHPTTGSVLLEGRDLSRLSPSQIAEKIGFVPQSLTTAFPFRVADIVVMGRACSIGMTSSPSKKDRQKAASAMARIGIDHLADRPCNRLSGGEWQLVLIARALTRSPKILILDEPTSHLDLGNQIRILEVVDSLAAQEITIIMASHFPDHAFISAGTVGILKERRLSTMGSPETVLTQDVLERTYGISVRVIPGGEGINRRICVPMLSTDTNRSVSI